MVCLDDHYGTIQWRFFSQQVIQQPMKWGGGIGPHRQRGPINQRLSKRMLKMSLLFHHYTISPLYYLHRTISPYLHFTMLTCVCIMCTISPYSFYHTYLPIHFTMWTWVCILCAIFPYLFHHSSVPIYFSISPFRTFHHYSKISYQLRRKKGASEQRAIELFGLDEGGSEEDVGKNNGKGEE